MDPLKKLSAEHNDVLKRAQLFEKATLECFENKKNLSKKEYIKMVSPCKALFKIGLVAHFKYEEIALFPILIKKSKIAEEKIRNLISEHSIITNKFNEFETIEEYDLSIQILNNLMKELSIHAINEENFFSTIHLSKDETTRIDEVASSLGF